jgi:ACR3 family arsenite efflux pump ArsB
MARRFLRVALKTMGGIAIIVFFFDRDYSDWGIGLQIACVAVAVACVFVWAHFELGDFDEKNGSAPGEPK